MKWYPLAIALTILCSAALATAETVRVPVGQQGETAAESVNRPARGSTMSDVENRFGQPQQRHSAVGNPPITRWVYPQYTVYFEHQHVVHTVLHAD